MANPEHLTILKKGVEYWNKWRAKNPTIQPDLNGANLRNANLRETDLRGANLWGADLSKTVLRGTNLRDAQLSNANLSGSYLGGESLRMSFLSVDDSSMADFSGANLSGANLAGANLGGADLPGVTFDAVSIGYTTFGNNDLSQTKGLDKVRHTGPSTIGLDTIYASHGQIPEIFLRGAGVDDTFIEFMHSLVASGQPIRYYSCFISYSSKNQAFAERLYNDLQAQNVRCWLASEDLKIGEKIRPGIDQAIRLYDKLLLVLSRHSVSSDWVEHEVETALARERQEKRIILFPVRLDDAVMHIDTGWPAHIKNTRNIGDFRHWNRSATKYNQAFARLLRDLQAEDAKP